MPLDRLTVHLFLLTVRVIGITRSSSPRPIIASQGAIIPQKLHAPSSEFDFSFHFKIALIDNSAFFFYISKSTNGTFMVFDSALAMVDFPPI
jgi:hypothetical protein